MSAKPPAFWIDIADADATVQAIAAGDEPPTVGKASGEGPSYRWVIDAAQRVLDHMSPVEERRRVKVRVHDGRGEGHTTAWCAPSAAGVELRKLGEALDFQADLDRTGTPA